MRWGCGAMPTMFREMGIGSLLFIVFVLVYSTASAGGYESYKGYKLFKAVPETADQKRHLLTLRESDSEADFLLPSIKVHQSVSMLLPPSGEKRIAEFLNTFEIPFEVKAFGGKVLEERYRQWQHMNSVAYASRNLTTVPLAHDHYRDLGQITEALQSLSEHYGKNVSLWKMDLPTHEGRDFHIFEIDMDNGTRLGNGSKPKKPIIIVESLIHAREWIAGAATLYVIDQLLARYPTDPEARQALDKYHWVFIPVANPDGYHHSWHKARFWRKNRHHAKGRKCMGVDLNRNFDVKWHERLHEDSCSNVYEGPHPFSERESRNIRTLVQKYSSSMQAYVAVHSYSQILFTPYLPPEHRSFHHCRELDRVGRLMEGALNSFGSRYQFGDAEQLLGYKVAGDSTDWVVGEFPWLYAYIHELRPTREFEDGFILPPEEIVPTGRELYASLMTMATEMKPVNKSMTSLGPEPMAEGVKRRRRSSSGLGFSENIH